MDVSNIYASEYMCERIILMCIQVKLGVPTRIKYKLNYCAINSFNRHQLLES